MNILSIEEKYTLKKEGEFYTTEILGTKFGFRKWTWGEKNSLTSECSHIDQFSVIRFDTPHFNEQLFLKTVYKFIDDKFVPFGIEEIRNADGQFTERLFRITQKLNLITNVETQNL